MEGMMTGLLLLLLAGVTVGRVVDLQKRIIGGQRCDDDEHLYYVKLRLNDRGLCGGTLIDKDWILTAGHCVPKVGTTRVTAFLGENRDPETNGVDIDLKSIKRKKIIFRKPHDIALLKLPASSGLKPADLPQCGTRPVLGTVEVAGDTLTTINSQGNKESHDSPHLLCAKMNVVQCDPQSCPPPGFNYKHTFCYKATGVDAWEGDSGGGVMVNNMIYGVHVSSVEQPCVRARATDVCEYRKWIKGVTGLIFP